MSDIVPGLSDPDDVSSGYQAYRQTATADDLIAKARQRQAAKPAAKPVTEGQPGAPLAPEAAPALLTPAAPKSVLEKAGAVAKDVGGGILELPLQALGGVSDAVHNTFTAADHLADWLNENVIDLEIGTPRPMDELNPIGQLLQNPAEAIAGKKNEVAPAETVTGNLARGVSQFIAGMAGPAKALKAAGAGTVGSLMGGGAVSDFIAQDPEEDTLSELIQSYPNLANPITELLASAPDDGEAEKRFKNAVEGLVGGELVDGFARAVRFAAQRRAFRTQSGAAGMPNQYDQPQIGPDDLKLLGDAEAPLVEIKSVDPVATVQGEVVKGDARVAGKLETGMAETASVPGDDAAKALAKSGAPGGEEVYINFARIDTPDDVKSVIGQMADAFAPQIDDARRGVRTNEATAEAADALGLSVADVLRRRRGQGFNAEEALAARRLLSSSGERLLAAAKKAAAPNASPADQFVFRKMMATHYAIQAEVIGARTETARALQSWRIPAGGGAEQMRAIETMLQGSGGSDVSKEMAKRLAILAENADTATINKAVRKGWGATTMDAVREFWINGLLSSPTTHIVNTASNFNVAMQQIGERGVAGKIARMTGSGGVAEGEATAMMFGLLTGVKDAFLTAGRAAVTGEGPGIAGKIDVTREPAITARAFNLDEAGGIGRTVDLLGSALRIPGRALETQDAFFKSIGYRMELHAQAYRQAVSEGLEGRSLGERVAQIVNDPPENIRLASADAALYSTFTNPTGEIGNAVMKLRGSWAPFSFILPFVRTPVNIARYSFERSPLAPLVGQWRADIAAGGARRDLALARMATGSAAMAVAADMAMNGALSGKGPDDTEERQAMMRAGWQPYSVKIGDKWYSYNRLDPLGQTLGFAADFTEAMNRGEIDPEDADEWQEIMAGGITAASQFAVSKTYLQGVADLTNVVTHSDRYSEGYVNNFVSSFLPFTSAMGAAERMADPTAREVETPMDAVLAKLPGLSDRLTPKRDLWGQEIRPDEVFGRAFDVLSPARVSAEKGTPVDQELLRLKFYPSRIGKKTTFNGVQVDLSKWPEVYDALVTRAGNELKHPVYGMGAREFLDSIVTGASPLSAIYQSYPDEKKANFIRDQIQGFRDLAKRSILEDPQFAAFTNQVNDLRQEKRDKMLAPPSAN